MVETSKEEFKQAYRREKDPRVVKRMAAVNMTYYNREHAAHGRSAHAVSKPGSDIGKAV